MLMRRLNLKHLVKVYDYVRFPPKKSAIIWRQRKRHVASPVIAPTRCASPVVENVLDSNLNYDTNERITPVPLTPGAVRL